MAIELTSKRRTNRKPFKDVIDKFDAGVITEVLESRLPKNAAKQATNLYQTNDGLWSTGYGYSTYGEALPNGVNLDGAHEYFKTDGTTELIAVGTKVYKSTDGSTWSEVTGATFTAGNKIFFLQIQNKLYMTNGVDDLAYYDGSTITRYTAISAPTGVIATASGSLTATPTSYSLFYQVTALNSVGETEGSVEVSAAINTKVASWTTGQYIDVSWPLNANARTYSVYRSDEGGYECYLATTTANSYRDANQDTVNPYLEVPDDNTTGAPKFRQMELSGNRIWATDDPDNKYRVYFSGSGQYIGFFSAYYGGGYIDLEKGGLDTPKAVVHYRTGKGDPISTVLCSSPEGKGSTWQIELTAVTVDQMTFTIPSATKIIGSVGTNAPLSVVKIGNSVLFFNKRGFSTIGSKANLLNILSVDEISFNIRPDIQNLDGSQIANVCGYFIDNKGFFSVPTSSSGNDKIFLYDAERKNWNPSAMDLGVKQFLEYTQTNGTTKFLGVPMAGTQLIQISTDITGYSGETYSTQYLSGLYPISTDRTVWAKIKYAYIEVAEAKGSITFSLLGTEKKKGYASLGSITISDVVSRTGYSFDRYSTVKYSNTKGTPSTYSSTSRIKRLRIQKLLNNYQFRVTTSSIDSYYTLLRLQVKGTIVPTMDPQSWKT